MVFQHLALHYLEKYLGDYIENFDSKTLKVGLWHGNLTIEKVYLKQNALNNLSIPIQIKTGYIEKLTIHIPWKHLYTHSTKISINGFYILLEPRTKIIYDPVKYKEDEYETKMKKVRKFEEFCQTRDEYQHSKKHAKHKDTFFERLQLHILRNLEISIENIHIDYHDKFSKPSNPFTITIMLHYFKLLTKNTELGEDQHLKILYKSGEINNLSIYWNSNVQFPDNFSKEDILLKINGDHEPKILPENYILRPLNATAQLEISRKAQKQDFQRPVLQGKIVFQQINLNINRHQYLDLLHLLEYYNYFTTKWNYIKYYVLTDYRQTDKPILERWKFAYMIILEERVRPKLASYQWKNIKQCLDQSKQYYCLYFQQLTGHLNKEEKERLLELEKKMNPFNLIYVRRRVQLKARTIKIQQKQMSPWDKISNWWDNNKHEDPDFHSDNLTLSEEREKFFQAIGYQDEHNAVSYPQEYVDVDVSVELDGLEVNVWSNINENEMQFKIIASTRISNLDLTFKRRPATDDFLLIINLNSFELYGNESNSNRPVLIQSRIDKEKLLQIQFETNPCDQNCDYRIFARSQSLDIIYHAETINKLIQCFLPDRYHHLERIKEAAYSIYSDIKHNTKFLLSENLKSIKALDIDMDFQPLFIIIPENDQLSNSSICFDFGHLIIKGGKKYIDLQQEIEQSSFVPIKIQLENIQLIYCDKNQDWKNMLNQNDSSSHIIKPITITLDIRKSIYIEHTNIPIWKVDGKVSTIDSYLSDKRIIEIVKVFQAIPLNPQSTSTDEAYIQKLKQKDDVQRLNTKIIYHAIEHMAPIKKLSYKEEAQTDQQIIEIEASFQIPSITMHLMDSNEPFIEISLVSILAQAKMKAYDIEFDLSLEDFVIIHQQFEIKENKKLYLFDNQHNEKELLSINGLLTSTENPLFSIAPYNSIENRIRINLSKSILNLQLEAFTSIILFKNNLMNKLSRPEKNVSDQAKPKPVDIREKNPSYAIEFNLEEFRVLIGNQSSQLLYIQLKDLQGNLSRTRIKTSAHLNLNDFLVIDPSNKSRFTSIISKENKENDLLLIDLLLSNQTDSHINGQIEKLNIFLLYKHIKLILMIINALNINESKQKTVPSNQPSFLQKQLSKLRCQINLNGPRIFIPKHSHSDQAILIDLGKLTIQTGFIDDQTESVIEEHKIIFEDLSISRIKLNNNNQIIKNIKLLQCSPINTLINRHLDPQPDQTKIAITIQWDQIDFLISKNDYLFFMEIFKENFNKKIPHKQKSNSPVKKQSNLSQLITINLQIKQISLTLYQDQTNINSKLLYGALESIQIDFQRSSNLTYQAKVQIQNLFADYLLQADNQDSIKRIIEKNCKLEPDKPIFNAELQFKPTNNDESRSIQQVNGELENFYICISPNYLISLKDFFISNIPTEEEIEHDPTVTVNEQIFDDIPPPAKYLLKSDQLNQEHPETTTNDQNSSDPVETNVNLTIKPCRLVLIEDENNKNSNCLVVELSVLMRLVSINKDSKLDGSIKDLTIYGTNFEELQQSKIKYHVFQPSQIDLTMIKSVDQQKIDVVIGNISLNVNPALIHTIISLKNSMGKQQINIKTEKDKINSKTIFNPKPFKDSKFWFIQDSQKKEETLEQTDILEITTGTPSKKKHIIQQQNKQKNIEKKKNLNQQLTVNSKLIEIKIQLDSSSTVRPVIALCLSEVSADLQNWSTELFISSSVQIELALFNNRLLAWEPFIQPIIHQRNKVVSPWSITCQTITDQQDQDEKQCRVLLDDKDEVDTTTHFDVKKVILIRADHLLNITITKTSIALAQRLFAMFNDTNKKEPSKIEDNDQSMLSIHNHTGYEIAINDIIGVEFIENDKSNKEISLKNNESIKLIIPNERLNATHLPTIIEQIHQRKQELSIKISERVFKTDINQTWRRVYQLSPSSIPNWPIEMLCNSQIHENRRRIILSSIIKVSNRTMMPLIILDPDSIEKNEFNCIARIDVDQEFYLPIDLLYLRMSPRLYFAIEEDASMQGFNDFMSFEWVHESSSDRKLKMKNGKEAHFVIYKQTNEAYSENTDEPLRTTFSIYVKLALHIINLLPINIQCLIDNIEQIDLKSSELCQTTSGNKRSVLIFTIPSYNTVKWISEPIDLKLKGDGVHNEHIVRFHNDRTNEILRMVLRVDTYRESYRASFYSPYWIVNSTDLKFEFKIETDKIFVDNIDQSYLLCPKKFQGESHKQMANIRLYSDIEDESISQWSETFSVDVIKSTGMTSCKVENDRTYMVFINIVTCSFGMTKIITIASSIIVINNSSIAIEISESITGTVQGNWKSTKPEEIIPFWPFDIREGVMCVRYTHNINASTCFSINNKHRTLLRMNDEEYPAIDVQVNITDFDGYRIIFSDYKNGDAPILLVNTLINQSIEFNQLEDVQTQILPPQNYVYYTWNDLFKPRQLMVSANEQQRTIELNPACGVIKKDGEENIYYAIFHDGPQTVLLFSREASIIESVTDASLLEESINNYIQIVIRKVGIAIINDINRDDLLYITVNQSKPIWTARRQYNIKPLSASLNHHLEEDYQIHIKHHHDHHCHKKQITDNKYKIDKNRMVSFNDDGAEINDDEGHRVYVKREKLDGIWIGYAWSVSNLAIHARVNHIQVDDQLQYTMFPTIFYPIVSKSAGTHIPGKPFIELSIFKSESSRSNTIHFKYFKLLIQEFAVCIDQGLISALFIFIKPDKNPTAPSIDMDTDLTFIKKPLESLIQNEKHKPSADKKIYFDNLHLSPLKIHISFSIHGSKPSEQLLAEHPLADFLLELLNIAEVEDAILKLHFYERKNDRYTVQQLIKEIVDHYEHGFLKQIHVVVLGLDVLGNPCTLIRGVAHGVQTFFYEPYQGAMEGPIEFVQGLGKGTRGLLGSVVGSAAAALSKVTNAASKSLATITLDKDYQNVRIQRKELLSSTSSHIVSSGKSTAKDIIVGVKGLVKKPVEGAKEHGGRGFAKGVGKGLLGLVGKPTSGVVDLTSTSLNSIKRVATHEQTIHRIRHPRHIGRDGIIRPSIAHETFGCDIFEKLENEHHEEYIAHINCCQEPPTYLLATTKRVLLVNQDSSSLNSYNIEWDYHYRQLKGLPSVKFDSNHIEFILKESHVRRITKKDGSHTEIVPYQRIGEARYIVDKITEMMHALQV